MRKNKVAEKCGTRRRSSSFDFFGTKSFSRQGGEGGNYKVLGRGTPFLGARCDENVRVDEFGYAVRSPLTAVPDNVLPC